MILEFKVKNFRCLRDEQVLSMIAASDTALLADNVTSVGNDIKVLNTAAIYGANTSGKSTLIKALHTFFSILSCDDGSALNKVRPCLMDKEAAQAATVFNLSFIYANTRYCIALEILGDKVVAESLHMYKSKRASLIYARVYQVDEGAYQYNYGSILKGNKFFIQNATRDNVAFLRMAYFLNNEVLCPIYEYIRHCRDSFIFDSYQDVLEYMDNKFALHMHNDNAMLQLVEHCIRSLDLAIDGIDIKLEPSDFREKYVAYFRHRTACAEASFTLLSESKGTLQIIFLLCAILRSLQEGSILIVDEINSSLHPMLVSHIVNMYNSKKLNTKGAQLIFSTHDCSLLSKVDKSLRRDQIYFMAKDQAQISKLYSLVEFRAQKDENIEKAYFEGKYGAIPCIDSIEDSLVI